VAAESKIGADPEPRIREWIGALSELPARFAGTAAERAAAERIGAWMRDLGISDVAFTPVQGAPRGGVVLAMHASLGALGCFAGGFLGALVALAAAWSFRSQFRRSQPLLSRLVRSPESVNVVGRVGATAPARRVVLSAHIDTAQAGWIFSRQLAEGFARANRTLERGEGHPQSPFVVPELLLMGAVAVAFGAWFGAHGFLFGLARALIGIGLVIECGLTMQWATAAATPGANDNASAVAAMLTCAEELVATLPEDVELWLVGTGAEEVGSCGMLAFVGQHAHWPVDSTYYLNFECVGGGALHFIRTEGMLAKSSYPPPLIELARRIAASGTFGEVTATDLLAATDGHVPARHGYPTLSLIALEPTGVPRNYHRFDDTVDGIDVPSVVRAAHFAAAVATAALHDAAGPIRTD
jgi:hypothetical protein